MLWTEDEQGEQVRIAGLWDDQEEARFVADEVEAWQRQGGSLNQAAVLVRAGFQTRSFEERFIQLASPTGSSADRASTSGPRSATPSPISA